MHGYLRLLLSFVVVLSHLGWEGEGVHFGIASVVVFYLLSGYVVTNLCIKFFPADRLKKFYVERFLRIYPLYFVLLLLSGAFVFSTGFGSPELSFWSVVGNLAIVPLSYYMFWQFPILTQNGWPLLGTAWSLGVEIQAYIVLPLILRSERCRWIIGVTSLLISMLATVGILHHDWWGYRLLPGVMFIFLAGGALCRAIHFRDRRTCFDVFFPAIALSCVVAVSIYAWANASLDEVSASVALGFLVGVPILWLTSKKARIPGATLAGQLSYGVFLSHPPLIWVYQYLFDEDIQSGRAALFVVSSSLWIALLTSLTVERLVWPWRTKFTTGQAGKFQSTRGKSDAMPGIAQVTFPVLKSRAVRLWVGALVLGASIVSVLGILQARLGVLDASTVPVAKEKLSSVGNGVYATSSPLRMYRERPVHHRTHVKEDGVRALKMAYSSQRVRQSSGGAYAISDKQIWFKAPDGSDPRTSGHHYVVVFPSTLPIWVEWVSWTVLALALPLWLLCSIKTPSH